MAFHALIAVPLSAERPGGLWAGAGPVAPVPPQTWHRTGVHHTNPSASGTRVSMAFRQPLPQIRRARPKMIPAAAPPWRASVAGVEHAERPTLGNEHGGWPKVAH